MIKTFLQWLRPKSAETTHAPTQTAEIQNNQVSPPVSSPLNEKEADGNLYDFKEVTLEEMKLYPDAVHDMYSGKTDGFLIKNFMPEADVDKLLECLKKVQQNDARLTKTDVGFTYPMVFAEYNRHIANLPEEEKKLASKDYYLRMENFNKTFVDVYGTDAHKSITDFFKSVGGGRDVNQPEGADDVGRFPFVTYRYLVPDQGLMSIHCANYFGTTFSDAYKHLNAKVKAKNQMSYFIMLQEAEEGGELSLFNFRWQPGQTKWDPGEDNEIIQPDGTKMYVQSDPSIRKNKVRPKKGDMILFQGGNIWHRVETVRGTIPRITFGGFLSLSHDDKTVYFWS